VFHLANCLLMVDLLEKNIELLKSVLDKELDISNSHELSLTSAPFCVGLVLLLA
jgi:hypothetical protein